MVYIHRKVAFATIILGIKFFPGMNTISDAEFTKLKEAKNKALDGELECGNMVLGGTVESTTSEAAKPDISIKERAVKIAEEVASVNVKKAGELIEKMGDGYVLRAIKKSDHRKGVQEAVDRRLKSILGQEGSDLTPSSKVAPLGNGSDFDGKLTGDQESVTGKRGHTAIPKLTEELM